jgi:hypothetical protein
MIVALIALFFSLGGTAVAALIITSNSQVAKNTISGHHPPKGAHANLIAGSVNAKDLAPGAVSGVVARPHNNIPVSTGDGGPVDYPLLGNKWVQGAKETDLITGEVIFTNPSSCGSSFDGLFVVLSEGTKQITDMESLFNSGGAGSIGTAQFTFVYVAESGSSISQTLTAKIFDNCPNPGENYIVNSVNVAIIGAH